MSTVDKDLQRKVEGIVSDEGAQLMELKVIPYRSKKTLRCVADLAEGGITVDTCASINSRIVSFLNESNLLGDDFTVEVNSPGLDWPLKTYRDFLRVKGKLIGLWLVERIDDKDYYEGVVSDINDKGISICDKKIDFNMIKVGKEKVQI